MQLLDVDQNLSTTNIINPYFGASLGAIILDILHTLKLLKDCGYQDE